MKKTIRATLLALSLFAPAVHAQHSPSNDSRLDPRPDRAVNNWQSLTTRDALVQVNKEQAAVAADRPCARLRISDDVNPRAGRIGLPVFLLAQQRQGGQAHALRRPAVILRAGDQAFAEAP